MAFLKDQHRPQPNRVDSAASNIDPEALHLLEQRTRIDRVESYVCSYKYILAIESIVLGCWRLAEVPLPPQIHDPVWVSLGQVGEVGLEDAADASLL